MANLYARSLGYKVKKFLKNLYEKQKDNWKGVQIQSPPKNKTK